MFYILTFTGISLIILGVFNDKNKISNSIHNRLSKPIDVQELNNLKLRIENLEDVLFHADEDEKANENIDSEALDDLTTYESVAASIAQIPKRENNKSTNALKTFKMVCQYEEENYTLEEICVLLNMNKGEVLLLKNLYKNY